MDKRLNVSSQSEDEETIINLKKVKIKEPPALDIDFFLNEIKNFEGRTLSREKAKPKPKSQKPTAKDQQKSMIEVPLKNLKKYSRDMMTSFKNILEEKFNTGSLSELDCERKSNMEKLFPYLCFGLQECFEARQFDDSDKLQSSQISLVSINLLKEIAFRIDKQLLNAHNEKKKTSPSLKFKSQWNFLLEIIKDLGNHKFRSEIISKKLKPKHLVYANEADLKEYLSEERQKNLKTEAEKIVRISQNDDLKLHFELKEKEEGQSSFDTDDETTVMSEANERIEVFKEDFREKEVKRAEPKSNERIEVFKEDFGEKDVKRAEPKSNERIEVFKEDFGKKEVKRAEPKRKEGEDVRVKRGKKARKLNEA